MKQKLELTWVGKNNPPNVEPRILLHEKNFDYGETDTENILIHGDNLLALKSLEQDFAGKIKCVYIDPPYNTGAAFEHYDDNLEHSIWLNFMAARLKILKNLLRDDGSIWINLDDNEVHYCKVMMDEIFGRQNFLCDISWEKRYSPPADTKDFGYTHDHILVYRKSKEFVRNLLPITEDQAERYKNPDNDPRGAWKAADYTCRFSAEQRPNLYYPIIQPVTGEKIYPKKTRVWANSIEEHEKNVRENRLWWGVKGTNKVPAKKNFLSEIQQGMMPMSLWRYEMAGTTQDARRESLKLFGDMAFDTPKPEKLIWQILSVATNPGDIVLDSFLGSGTTAAVAHKMGRRWIGIELEKTCFTHCISRLKKVIDGEQGGISKNVNWQGGGGFKFYELAPTLIVKDKFGMEIFNPQYDSEMLAAAVAHKMGRRWIGIELEKTCFTHCISRLKKVIDGEQGGISKNVNWQGGGGFKFYELAPTLIVKDKFGMEIFNPQYDSEMLAAAVAKHNGFIFMPDENIFWKQGKSQENSFIYTTTNYLTTKYLDEIAREMRENENLLICASAFDVGLNERYENISVKKIPQSLLKKCEYDVENYDLKISEGIDGDE